MRPNAANERRSAKNSLADRARIWWRQNRRFEHLHFCPVHLIDFEAEAADESA